MNVLKKTTLIAVSFLLVYAMPSFCADIREQIRGLRSSDAAVRLSAVQGLGQVVTGESTDALVSLLGREKDAYVRMQIIESLTLHQSSTALTAVLSTLDDPSPYVRQKAVEQLVYFGNNERIASALAAKLPSETNEAVKMQAVNTLGAHRNKTAADAVSRMLGEEKDINIRKTAVYSLGRMKTKEAQSTMERYKNDPELKADVDKAMAKRKKARK